MTVFPVGLQRDIRGFFGSYAKACRQADDLLFRPDSRNHEIGERHETRESSANPTDMSGRQPVITPVGKSVQTQPPRIQPSVRQSRDR